MIVCKNGATYVEGNEAEVLADFGALAKCLANHCEKDRIIEVCLLGVFAENRDQMEKIHKILKAGGMDV